MWGWVISAGVLIVAGICVQQYRAQRGVYRPLSSRQPARRHQPETPLGMEATDLSAVNRINRRNEALERSHAAWSQRAAGSQTGAAATDIQPLADDETYAKRFHTAFLKDKE